MLHTSSPEPHSVDNSWILQLKLLLIVRITMSNCSKLVKQYLVVLFIGLTTSIEASSSFACPDGNLSGPVSLEIPTDAVANASTNGGIALETTSTVGELCTLTLEYHDESGAAVSKPIARSYDGNGWEKTAGAFSQSLPKPDCSSDSASCTIFDLPPPEGNKRYHTSNQTIQRHETWHSYVCRACGRRYGHSRNCCTRKTNSISSRNGETCHP